MTHKEKTLNVCAEAAAGKLSPEKFYDRLSEIADDSRTPEELAILIEDVLMELEMEGVGKKLVVESASRLMDDINENITD